MPGSPKRPTAGIALNIVFKLVLGLIGACALIYAAYLGNPRLFNEKHVADEIRGSAVRHGWKVCVAPADGHKCDDDTHFIAIENHWWQRLIPCPQYIILGDPSDPKKGYEPRPLSNVDHPDINEEKTTLTLFEYQ